MISWIPFLVALLSLVSQPIQESWIPLPESVTISMPFYTQAPDGNWSLPWQETCEEASILLSYHAVTDQPLDLDTFRNELLNLVDWQNERFGDYQHTSVDQTAEMIRDYLGYQKVRILENPTPTDLKRELALGRPIVAPFAGQELENPFYTNDGPYYHMLVIRGYDATHFVTNDVGTKRGEGFRYPQQTIMDALHDWHSTDITQGSKRVIVFEDRL
ncbi:C39 family peptidase [Candidatus Peregrinibacteria bacterium]|nr:MAG: C39 family peptidase [Candidatus Peregrinibacteria bacterium]